MPGISRRSDKGKYRVWYIDDTGKRKFATGFTDKRRSEELANQLEHAARMVREGLADPTDRACRAAGARSIIEHVEDYRLSLAAKQDKATHCRHIAGAIQRVLADAAITTVADIATDRLQLALGRLAVKRSARTANHALGAVKAFTRWLLANHRIREIPRGLAPITRYNEKSDRKKVRRALTHAELERLFASVRTADLINTLRDGRGGKVIGQLTGPEREILYRLAAGTGFRADEIRTLTPERFDLATDKPTVIVLAAYSKNGDDATQPIRSDLAEILRPFLADKEPGKPVLAVPEKTAQMLARDLKAAGIEPETEKGLVDFHSIRHTYITHLVASGMNPKTVQKLARHSTITLTIDRYSFMDQDDLRSALDKTG
jgi:integrase